VAARDPQEGSTGRGGLRADEVNLGRGLVVIVVAVVLGIVLLQVATKSPSSPASASASPAASHHHTPPAPTTTTTTVPASSVHVLVANGVGYGQFASEFDSQLQTQGFSVLPAQDANSTVPASSVYYAPGSQAQAALVAKALGLSQSVVQPVSSSVPVSSTTGANVVVIIGPDLAARAPGGSTTTTAAGTTSTT
jgi:hypothetical protein